MPPNGPPTLPFFLPPMPPMPPNGLKAFTFAAAAASRSAATRCRARFPRTAACTRAAAAALSAASAFRAAASRSAAARAAPPGEFAAFFFAPSSTRTGAPSARFSLFAGRGEPTGSIGAPSASKSSSLGRAIPASSSSPVPPAAFSTPMPSLAFSFFARLYSSLSAATRPLSPRSSLMAISSLAEWRLLWPARACSATLIALFACSTRLSIKSAALAAAASAAPSPTSLASLFAGPAASPSKPRFSRCCLPHSLDHCIWTACCPRESSFARVAIPRSCSFSSSLDERSRSSSRF